MKPISRVAAVHDLSGYGRCSLSVVYPVLSVMGIQCCSLPTAFLSTHTGHDGFTFHDMTSVMRPAAAHWKQKDFTFDAVYSGFLGSVEQIDIVCEVIDTFRRPGMLAVVDPVMGDHGKPYRTYTPDMCKRMSVLADAADIITPNMTEAAILLGQDYADVPTDEAGVMGWLEQLSRKGTRSVVLTGVTTRDGAIGSAYCDTATRAADIYFNAFVGQEYHGTGDLYTSVLLGTLLHGHSLAQSVEAAAQFVRDCAELSWGEGTPMQDGVRFEALMWTLGNR